MAITYTAPREPLAGPPGGETSQAPLVFAETQAGDRLRQIIERYCKREIPGRSILVAGHRGAGKTTSLKTAIEKLQRSPALLGTAIPLYVEIHGPDLLGGETVLGTQRSGMGAKSESSPNGDKGPAPADNASPANDASAAGGSTLRQKDDDEIEQALTSLRVLTIALHRAFVTDLGWSFERGVSPQQVKEGKRPHKRRSDDLQELAAQLRLDFDDLVETDGLRWVWDRAGILHDGVLRPKAPDNNNYIADRYFSKQGLLEIVAATCVSESYARSVAKIDDADRFKAEAEFKQTREMEKLAERKELTNAVAGIIAGGMAGGGAALAKNGPLAGLLFIVTAVLTTLVLNYTSVRSRTRTRSREKNIQWDRSVASLDLMLPLSIARVLDAGRAPVFVIDELDKVNEIEKKLERLINRLKHIVADRALFCFLVDRSYFERVQTISLVEPQRKEHTFFSERLYVIATPSQWRKYLKEVLKLENPTPEDKLQQLALTYVLLARSKMHAIDLRRELEALPRSASSPNQLDLPDLLGPALYRNMIYMQAVVEFVLEEDAVKRRLLRDPNFAQSTYDALYYLLRQWEQDKEPELTEEKVRAYLRSRATEGHVSHRSPPQMTLQFGWPSPHPQSPAPVLSDVDFKVLYGSIQQVARLLSNPTTFKASVEDKLRKTFSEEWNDVKGMIRDPALLQLVGDKWYWLFDINANALQVPQPGAGAAAEPLVMQPAPVQQDPVAATLAAIRQVEEVDAAIRLYTDDRLTLEELGTELRLLPVSPTFKSFEACASQYRAHAGAGHLEETYPSLSSDKSLIQTYATTVWESNNVIKRVIFLAEFLGHERIRYRPQGAGVHLLGSRLRSDMVRFIATNLDFARLNSTEIDQMLSQFWFEDSESEIVDEFRKIEVYTTPLDGNWATQIQLRIGELYRETAPPIARWPPDEAWIDVYFRDRADAMILHLRKKQDLKPFSLRDLRVLASARLPSGFEVPAIHGDPDKMTLLDYADALTATRQYAKSSALTLAVTLLVKLGFGRQVETFVPQYLEGLKSDDVSDLFEAARANRRPGDRVFLVLGGSSDTRISLGANDLATTKKGEGSYAAKWALSKTHAVYPIHDSDKGSLFSPALPEMPPLITGLELSLEIHDEDVLPSAVMPQLNVVTVGGAGIGIPESLDDAVAMAKLGSAGAAL
jgi:hypothetical protein